MSFFCKTGSTFAGHALGSLSTRDSVAHHLTEASVHGEVKARVVF